MTFDNYEDDSIFTTLGIAEEWEAIFEKFGYYD